MASRDYVTAIVQNTLAQCSLVGIIGSTAYNSSLVAALAALLASVNSLSTRILTQEGGKIATSVAIPGQTVQWREQMTLSEQMLAIMEAWNILQGNVTVIRRTVARHF